MQALNGGRTSSPCLTERQMVPRNCRLMVRGVAPSGTCTGVVLVMW